MDPSEPSVSRLQDEIEALRSRVRELEAAEAERQRIAEALQESQELLRQTAESLPIVLLCAEANTNNILLMIGGVKEILGYDAEAFVAEPDLGPRIIHPDDAARVYDGYRQGLATRRPFELEYRVVRGGTGEIVWLYQRVVPVFNPDGSLFCQNCFILDISQRKRAEISLRESEARFRLLSEGALTGVYIFRDDRFLYVNPAMAHIFGYEPEELMTDCDPLTLVHPEDHSIAREHIRRRLTGEVESAHYSFRGRRKDGHVIHCEARGRRIEYQGRPAVLGTLIDITERKLAEEALRESEERYRLLVENIDLGIAMIDADYNIVMTNTAIGRMARKPVSELLGCKCFAQFRKAGEPCRVCPGAMAMASGQPAEAEAQDVLEDGSVVVVRGRAFPTKGPDGRTNGFVEVVEDITQRHRAERALHESQERLRAVVEGAPIVLFSIDRDGTIRLCEGKTPDALGLRPQDFVGRNAFEQFSEVPDLRKNLERALSGETFTATLGLAGRFFEIWHSPRRDENGQITGIIGVANDITERNRLHMQLLQSQKLESIGTLAGGVAHDFGNLLAVIMGNTSMLLRQKSMSSKSQELLRDVMDAAERASDLTHQLLAYARGGLKKPAPTDLNRHVESVLKILKRTAPRRIEFVLNLAADLPPIVADTTQMEQVAMNLCLNAIQASQPPSEIEVSSTAEHLDAESAARLEFAPGQYVRLSVRDHGCGMDPRTLSRVFEPFFTTKAMGRGMGLAATQGIIHNHKGQIRIESAAGRGTTVSVWLPAAPAESSVQVPELMASAGELPHGCETILVIDDQVTVTRIAEQALSSLGYCTVSHVGLGEALAFLDTNAEDIDLILLSSSAAQLTTGDSMAEIRRRCPDVPILVAGRAPTDDSSRLLLEQGVAGFVHKPYSLTSLAATVRKALDNSPRAQHDVGE